jgi:hypothetical protein
MKCVQHEHEWKNYRSSSCIKYYVLLWQVWIKLCATTYSRHLLQPAKITQSDENERGLGSVLILQTSPPTKQVISPQLQLDLNFNDLEVVIGYLYVLVRFQQVPCWSQPRGRSKMFSDDLHLPQTYESLDTVTTAVHLHLYASPHSTSHRMKQNSCTNSKKCNFLSKKISGKYYTTHVLWSFVCKTYATDKRGKTPRYLRTSHRFVMYT